MPDVTLNTKYVLFFLIYDHRYRDWRLQWETLARKRIKMLPLLGFEWYISFGILPRFNYLILNIYMSGVDNGGSQQFKLKVVPAKFRLFFFRNSEIFRELSSYVGTIGIQIRCTCMMDENTNHLSNTLHIEGLHDAVRTYTHNFALLLVFFFFFFFYGFYGAVWRKTTKPGVTSDLLCRKICNFSRVCVLVLLS